MRRVARAFALMLSIAALCSAQESSPACDFSQYEPLMISHSLVNAATRRVEPKYPKVGHLRVAGKVRVKIIVDRAGDVVASCVTQGHPFFRAAAIQAANEWKFKRNFGFTSKPKRKYVQSFIVLNFKL